MISITGITTPEIIPDSASVFNPPPEDELEFPLLPGVAALVGVGEVSAEFVAIRVPMAVATGGVLDSAAGFKDA